MHLGELQRPELVVRVVPDPVVPLPTGEWRIGMTTSD
jgi:hypothetical protein